MWLILVSVALAPGMPNVAAEMARRLAVYVDNDKLLDRLIEEDPLQAREGGARRWETIRLDLKQYQNRKWPSGFTISSSCQIATRATRTGAA